MKLEVVVNESELLAFSSMSEKRRTAMDKHSKALAPFRSIYDTDFWILENELEFVDE